MTKPKPMGRPPLRPEKKKVRLHISVAPDIAAAALGYCKGASRYFEHAVWALELIKRGEQHADAE